MALDSSRLPARTRVYENHHLDSPRWDRFETRPGDIVITTAYKSGTTWTQTIVANLLFPDGVFPGPVMDISPWIDMRVRPFDEIVARTQAQTHRRFLKTHLPLDGIPYDPQLRYIFVGRDLRDVFMSLWNHYSAHTPAAYEAFNNPASRVGDPFPRCPADILDLWRTWANRGWFAWEKDGYPYWSSSHHAQTWWDWRHLPNLLFVHFADLLAEPAAEIRRIGGFLDIPIGEDRLAQVVEAVRLENVKKNADAVVGQAAMFFEGGGQRFLNKGTNGRWKGVLGEPEQAEYRAMVARTLSPECARWLEQGRSALVGAANG